MGGPRTGAACGGVLGALVRGVVGRSRRHCTGEPAGPPAAPSGTAAVEARELDDDGAPRRGHPAARRRPRRTSSGSGSGSPVRWVWDDTTRWYPALLEAGVRVERCTDLRLSHAVLRRSPFVDQALLAGDDTAGLGRAPAGHRRRPRALPARRPRRPARPGRRARAAAGGARRLGRSGAASACCSRPSPPARWWPPR